MDKSPLALYEKIRLGRGVTLTPLNIDGDYVEVEIRGSSPEYLDDTETVLRAMETIWLRKVSRVIPFPRNKISAAIESPIS